MANALRTATAAFVDRLNLLAGTAISSCLAFAPVASASDFNPIVGPYGFSINSPHGTSSEVIGRAVSTAGDMDGDGRDDIIIGSELADRTGTNAGAAYVWFGRDFFDTSFEPDLLAMPNYRKGFILTGLAAGDKLGNVVASAGDVNGDGFSDVIVSASGADEAGLNKGSAYVVFGRSTAFATSINVSQLDGKNGFRIGSAAILLGFDIAGAGDVNGDGFDDLLVGSGQGATGSGSVYVIFGKAGGMPSFLDLSSLSGAAGFRIDGQSAGDELKEVGTAGDVNGDGIDDILVAATDSAASGSTTGSAYVVFGKAAAFDPVVNVSSLDGGNGFRIDGSFAKNSFGFSIDGAGDVNGDGLSDILIGDFFASPGGLSDAGAAYLIFGSNSFASVVRVSELNGTDGFAIHCDTASERCGGDVVRAGDINADGFSDIAVSAAGASNWTFGQNGGVVIVLGKSSPFDAVISPSLLDGSNGLRISGANVAGWSISSAGDFILDGFPDFLFGMPGPGSAIGEGNADFLSGNMDLATVSRTGAAGGQFIQGNGQNNVLSGLGGDDGLHGSSGGDVLDGGEGSDTASYRYGPAVTANLATPASNTSIAEGDSYISIENLAGSWFGDVLTGDGGANRLSGDKGNDRLSGLAGSDIIDGGEGSDTQAGGSGNDTFVFGRASHSKAGKTRDVITDFNAGSATTAVDKIDLVAIDANTSSIGNQAFKFIGTKPFSRKKGQLRVKPSTSGAIVQGDVTGDGKADLEIKLKGFTKLNRLTAMDFRL